MWLLDNQRKWENLLKKKEIADFYKLYKNLEEG